MAFSYEVVRRSNRDPSWAAVAPAAVTPSQVELAIRDEFRESLERLETAEASDDAERLAATAAALLIKLCDEVEREPQGEPGLAAQLASIAITDLNASHLGPSGELYAAAQIAALEADRPPRH